MPTKITPAVSAPHSCMLPFVRGLSRTLALLLLLSGTAAGSQQPDVAVLQDFYAQRDFAPVWSDPVRQLELAQLSRLAEMHGLNGDEYRLPQAAGDATLRAKDLQISHTVLRLATHLRYSQIDPTGTAPRTRRDYDHTERVAMLHDVAQAESLFTSLDNLAPHTLLYRRLQLDLARLQALQAGDEHWPLINAGRVLEPGMHDSRVPELRRRLGLPAPVADETLYDPIGVAALQAFQTRHRLEPDGILGPRTRHALNVSLGQRIDQLRVNLEWQRWNHAAAGTDYLRVNIPHYTLEWVENGTRSWSMRTQVGNNERQTPVFRSAVNAISANPVWTVPPTIFREDILPHLRSDASYLQQKHMYVVDRRGRSVDPNTIDWRTVSADDFPYRLRRKPGAGNALGRMKFLLPNPYLIYLHDTPAKQLFEANLRATSSGCIRVEDPDHLADFLVSLQQQRSRSRLAAAKSTDRPRYIGLDAPVPIVVLYATIDLGDDGQLVYADDIYRRDPAVLALLDSSPEPVTDVLLASLTDE